MSKSGPTLSDVYSAGGEVLMGTLRCAQPRKMSPRRRKRVAPGAGVTALVLRLYVVAGAPNSVQAIANLEAICREYLKEGHRLEVVDVLEHPRRALADGVLVTPSLAKLSPRPRANLVGNLNDRGKVLLALGVRGRGE